MDIENNMYEGSFRFGKKSGKGRLTRCNPNSESNTKPEIIEGVWQDDELVGALPDASNGTSK